MGMNRGLLLMAMCFSVLGFSQGWAQVRSQAKLFNQSFLSPSFEGSNQNQYQFLGIHLKNEDHDNGIFQTDIEGAFAFGAPLLSYTKINEIYVQIPTGETQKLSIGRQKMNWSELDTRWNFGVWQPVFKWNPLSPESQGLFGLFWNFDTTWSSMSFFASPIYFPSQGPNFEINQNGEFVKGNPWFRRPPDSIKILDEVSKVEYTFDKPTESSVVLQSSYGAKFRVFNTEGSRIQFSLAYKPMNILGLGYDGVLDIAKDRGSVTIQPAVYYHSLMGLDMVWVQKFVKFGVSSIWEKPQKTPEFEPRWTYPEMDPSQIVSGFIDFDFRYVQFSLERLKVFGGDVNEVGDLASADRAAITTRYSFKEANRMSLKNVILVRKGRKILNQLALTQSALNQFQIVQLKSQMQFSSTWTVYGDLQLVKADELTRQNQNEIAQFANNDQLSLGVNYAF